MEADDLMIRALALPPEVRRRMGHALLDSVEGADPGHGAAWAAELGRRLDDVVSGRVQGIDAEEVDAEIDAYLARGEP